jgi:hypothetical protein
LVRLGADYGGQVAGSADIAVSADTADIAVSADTAVILLGPARGGLRRTGRRLQRLERKLESRISGIFSYSRFYLLASVMNSCQVFRFQFKTAPGVSTADHGSRITDHGLRITRKKAVLALALTR